MSSVWNFYCSVADVPTRETSLSSDELGETSAVHRPLSMGKPVVSIQVVNFKCSLRVNKKNILGEYYSFFKPSMYMWYHYYTSTE